jgi:hypothetical protein
MFLSSAGIRYIYKYGRLKASREANKKVAG